jgi:hypothetical protein
MLPRRVEEGSTSPEHGRIAHGELVPHVLVGIREEEGVLHLRLASSLRTALRKDIQESAVDREPLVGCGAAEENRRLTGKGDGLF